ncbi:MAG: dienelactone hydrolase family protein [Cyclobacteriaceae bacterium]
MKYLICFNLLLLSIVALSQSTTSELTTAYGRYTVGYYHKTLHDSSRTYSRITDIGPGGMPRPIPLSVWYPSSSSIDGKHLSLADYLQIHAAEREWERLPADQFLNWFSYQNTAQNRSRLAWKTKASRDLSPANGKFPIVIYTPGLEGTSIENFAICELLASHGFVVLAYPSRGTDSMFPDMASLKDILTQTRDLEFVMSKAVNLVYANEEKIAVMGFSFGGMAGVLAQMKNNNIDAVVSLDGSIRYQYDKIRSSAYFDITRANVPFIHFAQKDIPNEILKSDGIDPALNTEFIFYDELRYSEAYALKLHHLTHMNFNAMAILLGSRDTRQDKSDVKIVASYKIVSTYVLQFLNAYLKNQESSLAFMTMSPPEHGFSEKILSFDHKDAISSPYTFKDFNETAQIHGYSHLPALYDSVKSTDPGFFIKEGTLNTLALKWLYNSDRPDYGIAVLQFAVTLYPQSSNLFDSLGEGYLVVSDETRAIVSFRKAVTLDPNNHNSKSRLVQLKK